MSNLQHWIREKIPYGLLVLLIGTRVSAWRLGIHPSKCQRHCQASWGPSGFPRVISLGMGKTIGEKENGGNQLLEGMTLSTPSHEVNTLLDRMIAYFESMIDHDTNRFYLLSYPQTPSDGAMMPAASAKEVRRHVHCPMRDLGSAWDATKALAINHDGATAERFPDGTPGLRDAIITTTKFYSSSLVSLERDPSALHLSPEILGEAPTIAHNALLLLGLVGSDELGLLERNSDRAVAVDGLARGILSRQRADGAFRALFDDDDVHRDMAFVPGEAMTALMEIYRTRSLLVTEDTRQQIQPAMLRALSFYRSHYEEGRKQNTIDSNYSIWQIQAISRLVLVLRDEQDEQTLTVVTEATNYCSDLCGDILRSPAWKLVSRGRSFYPNLSTVEIACGLDALGMGARVLLLSEGEDGGDLPISLVARHIDAALDFLVWAQDRVPADAVVGYGGLGHGGYCVTEQRLDVTGHALGAVANLVELS